GGQTPFLCFIRHFLVRDQPALARACIAAKALAGASVDYACDVPDAARSKVRIQSPCPSDRDNQVNWATILNRGEGAGGGFLPCSSAGGDPLLFLVALGPEPDSVSGAVGPAAREGLEFAGHGGDERCAGHSLPCEA